MRFILFLVCTIFGGVGFANDGAFYAQGNQLIPILETDISVKKEVLTIKRIENGYLRVTVAYIFDNPTGSKELLVGFEAPSPSGDVDGTPRNGQHPYMSNFSVVMNGIPIRYETALVKNHTNFTGNETETLTESEALGDRFSPNDPAFYYVYHFDAKFNAGLNTIEHTYNFKLSGSVMSNYSFSYILTAANRWANKGIDDFTLIIDLGEFQHFLLSKTFFENKNEWTLNGKMKEASADLPPYLEAYKTAITVYCKSGPLVFTKRNFHPEGELEINAFYNFHLQSKKVFDQDKTKLSFDIGSSSHLIHSSSENAYKILRNLPYARRGYVFKTAFIQDYYEAQEWYLPNPNYVSNVADLKRDEVEWLEKLVKP